MSPFCFFTSNRIKKIMQDFFKLTITYIKYITIHYILFYELSFKRNHSAWKLKWEWDDWQLSLFFQCFLHFWVKLRFITQLKCRDVMYFVITFIAWAQNRKLGEWNISVFTFVLSTHYVFIGYKVSNKKRMIPDWSNFSWTSLKNRYFVNCLVNINGFLHYIGFWKLLQLALHLRYYFAFYVCLSFRYLLSMVH